MARGRKAAAVQEGPVEGPWDLPEGWRWERLEAVAPVNPRRRFDELPADAKVAFVPMAAVTELTGEIDLSEERTVGAVSSGFSRFASGDVIFAKITPCMENGKLAVVPIVPHRMAAGSTEFHVLEPRGVGPAYLFHYLSQRQFRQEAEHHMTGTAGQKRVPTDWLRNARIPVPPSQEAEVDIVARIESLLDDIDEGEAALTEARAATETYRQALLKAAVTGDLTADWRAANPQAETGQALLTRILAERRARWEADPKNARKKYVEPKGPDLDSLPALQGGRAWATVQQISTLVTSGSRGWSAFYADEGSLFIRAANLNQDRLDLSSVAFVQLPHNSEGTRTKVMEGDFLITITGANVTKCGVVDQPLADAYVSQHVGLVRPVIAGLGPYLHLWSRAFGGGKQYLEDAAYGAGKPGLNLPNIYEMAIALPGPEEQREILSQVRKCLDQLTVGGDAESLAEQLRQSILAAAFRGELLTEPQA